MISDDELRHAAEAWVNERLKRLPESEKRRFETSPEFERKMKRLIERTDHPAKYWLKKSFACFLLLIFLSGGGALALSREARAAFSEWTRTVFETHFEYRYVGENSPAPENTVYLPTWIPDGFEVFRESYDKEEVHVFYMTKEGNLAYFLYYLNNSGTALQIVEERGKVEKVYVGKYPADLYLDDEEGENNALVWTDTQRNALFVIAAPNSGEDLIKMAESVADAEIPRQEQN